MRPKIISTKLFPVNKPLLVNITGPTASGKTALAIRLARALDTEIISADSRQIYKEMQIGTAVPSPEELAAAPHHFIREVSVFDPPYTAAWFEKEALERISRIARRRPVILMAGGTGLYFHAVNFGLDDVPPVPEEIRQTLLEEWEREGGKQKLLEELRRRDPEYYRQADLHNPRRVLRALEVIRHTGKPFSSFRKGHPKPRPFDTLWLGLTLPREELYARIDRRTDDMMRRGLLDEARTLYPHRRLTPLQTVGYRELFDYFDGKISLDRAVEEIKKNTRRYAKRQLTWFKKYPQIIPLDMRRPEQAVRQALELIETKASAT
ncbi:MAG: tRNA (adenosine(37)-N6)-dimethylallyltransferase MiaA [Chlorobi bacterium]|nr:tRNA (adenosine(37)-N6)-dimethylallyltransferase MiaA [Chlorobiota bacterium]